MTREGVPLEDEVARLTRDLELARAALKEMVEAQKALGEDSYGARDIRRWNAALLQAEQVYGDLTDLVEFDGHPMLYFFCQKRAGHGGLCSVLPHTPRFIHGAGEPEV